MSKVFFYFANALRDNIRKRLLERLIMLILVFINMHWNTLYNIMLYQMLTCYY